MSISYLFSRGRHGQNPTAARFLREEDGAITIDWVVLTGLLVFLGIAASFFVATSVPTVADKISTGMKEMPVVPN